MAEARRARRQSIASSGRASTVSIPSEPGEQYDALNTENIAGSTTYKDRSTWFPEAASFIQSKPGGGLEGQWIGVRPLGQGSYGIAGLWEKRNNDGEVVDEIVVKQFLGGLNYKWNPKVPKEVRIMKLMNKTHCRGVVRLRAYRRYCHKKVHRLYLRYCPYGDLRRLIDRYRRFRRYLPEAFLWAVFYYLADAADAMANGPEEWPGDEDDNGWDFQVVHMDIKPDNIFLGYEDKDSGGVPYYPTAKLGDFGVSRECYLKDPENPDRLMEAGTRGWQAPEQLQAFYDVRKIYRKAQFKIYGHTNIWAIGAVMYELMTLRRVDRIWLYEAEDLHHGINPIMTLHRPEYSRSLKDAIRDCLKPYPEERPSAQELLERIEDYRRRMHKHLSEDAGEDPTEPIPGAGQRLYYRGNEINKMRPGKERLNPDDEEKDPGDADGKFRDPNLSRVRFPQFSDAALSKKEPKKNKVLGRNDIVRENEEDAKEQAQLGVVWNRWHARENDGVDLKAHAVAKENEEGEDPDDYLGDGDGESVVSDSLPVNVDSEYEDGMEEDPSDYSGDGEWRSNPSDSSNARSEGLHQGPKGNQRRQGGGKRLSDPTTHFSSSSKGKRKAPRNEPADFEREDEEDDQSPIQNYRRHRQCHGFPPHPNNPSSSSKGKREAPGNDQPDIEGEDDDEEDQSPIQNYRRHKNRNKRLRPPNPPSSSRKRKRNPPRNNQADIEHADSDPGSDSIRTPKRRRGLKTHPTPPNASEESSEDPQSGIGPEEGGQAAREETEGEIEVEDENNGTYNDDTVAAADDDDDYTPPVKGIERKPRRVVSWGWQSYQAPRRRRKRAALGKK